MKVKRRFVFTLVLVIIIAIAVATPGVLFGPDAYAGLWRVFVVGPRHRSLRNVTFAQTPQRMSRGAYLVQGPLGCFRCHSDRDWNLPGAPPVSGREGAGHVFADEDKPWLVAPNLTSDPETGAGRWTDDMLARAIREGIGHDGRILAPQMWYRAFSALSDEDLASVIVYLRSLPRTRNALPQTQLPLSRKLRYAGIPEPILAPVVPDVSTPQKRGEYLANIADCAGCHTSWYHPDAPMFTKLFAGGNSIDGPNHFSIMSPNITFAPSGIGYYDSDLFVAVMRTGHVKARALQGIMPWAWYGHMSDQDLRDIYAYLQSQETVKHVVDNSEPPTFCKLCLERHGGGDRN
jgi:mono/diheme cytochrome c family protein